MLYCILVSLDNSKLIMLSKEALVLCLECPISVLATIALPISLPLWLTEPGATISVAPCSTFGTLATAFWEMPLDITLNADCCLRWAFL